MAALIRLEAQERGRATISAVEYERWGDYDGPAADDAAAHPAHHGDDDDPHTPRGLTKEMRHAAAVAATREVLQTHLEHRQLSRGVQPARPRRPRLRGLVRLLGRLRLRPERVAPGAGAWGGGGQQHSHGASLSQVVPSP